MFYWIQENSVSAVLFLIALFCLFQLIWLKRDFFSPISVYCFSQCLTLGVAYLQLLPMMTSFRPETWMVWILGMLSFCSGCFLMSLVGKMNKQPMKISAMKPLSVYNWKLHLLLTFIPFCLFLVGIWKIVDVAGNLLVFTGDPSRWMSKSVNYGHFPILFSSAPLSVLLFGVASFKKMNNVRWIRNVAKVMVVVTMVISFMGYPNRTFLFFNVGFLLIMINFLYKRISPIVILIMLVLSVVAFVAISNLRGQYGGGALSGKTVKVMTMLPYQYVANNYWNLDYAVSMHTDREIHPTTYGMDFFSGIFEYTGITNKIRQGLRWDDAFNDRVKKVGNLNTINYLWEVYKDFLMPGILILPFLFGAGLTCLYNRLSRPFAPRTIVFYTFFIYFVGWSFFTTAYKQGIYWLWAGWLYLIPTICMKWKLPADTAELKEVSVEHDGKDQVPDQSGEGNEVIVQERAGD